MFTAFIMIGLGLAFACLGIWLMKSWMDPTNGSKK